VSVGLRPVSGGQGARPMMPQSPSPPEQKQRRHRLQPRLLGCSASRVVSSPDASSGGGEGMLDRPQGPRAAALARPSGGSASGCHSILFVAVSYEMSISHSDYMHLLCYCSLFAINYKFRIDISMCFRSGSFVSKVP